VISLDYETACDLDIRRVGLDCYTAHPSFRVLMAAYRIDDGPLRHWQAHQGPAPVEMIERLRDPAEHKWAFNAQFERLSTARGLAVETPIAGWRCSMVLAYMRSFMGGLADVGEQMLIPADQQKQKLGSKLIRQFCKPQKVTKNFPHVWRDWATDPQDWYTFTEYNKADVIAEEAVRDRLSSYPTLEDEWEFYALDQRVNDRGMPFDRVFATNIALMSERRREELFVKMRELTGLANPNSQRELLRWLNSQGYGFENIGEHTVTRALTLHGQGALGLTEPCVKVLRLRQWAARSATKKAQAALRSAGDDDRIRYMFQFVGASRTGRASGRLVQPQNMARTPKLFDPEKSSARLDAVTDLIRQGDYDTFSLLVDEPMLVFGGTMRGMFRARPGYRLHVCDYSSIESVGLAWLSGCDRMLDVFRRKRDFYRDFGSSLYRKPYDEITSAERQVSKSACLGCLGGDTKVLTDSGWKAIIHISVFDRVFDGVEFVSHQGVVDQGTKSVIDLYGLSITPDHLVLCGDEWCEADEVTQNFQLGWKAIDLGIGAFSGLCFQSKLSPIKGTVEARTYDIASCGPRNRFMAMTDAGPVIVHNCGYGLGPGQVLPDGSKTGLLNYASSMDILITPDEAQAAVAAYRQTYAEVPLFWRQCDNAADSVLETHQSVEVGPLVFEWVKPFLLIRLPSDRCIYYYKPRIETKEVKTGKTKWDQDKMRMVEETYFKQVLTFMGRNQRVG
jgi:hypothetical protein